MIDQDLEQRLERIEQALQNVMDLLDVFTEDVHKSISALRDGYPELTIVSCGSITESVLRRVWKKEGIKGSPAKRTLEPLMQALQNFVDERIVCDYVKDIQSARNRAAHGETVLEEDALEALRKLAKILDWYLKKYEYAKNTPDDELSSGGETADGPSAISRQTTRHDRVSHVERAHAPAEGRTRGEAQPQPSASVIRTSPKRPDPKPPAWRPPHLLRTVALSVLSVLVIVVIYAWVRSRPQDLPWTDGSVLDNSPGPRTGSDTAGEGSPDGRRTIRLADSAGLRQREWVSVFNAKIRGWDCASITMKPDRSGLVKLSGYVRDQVQLTALHEQLSTLQPRARLDVQAVALAEPFCDILSQLRAIRLSEKSDSGIPSIEFNRPDHRYHDNDYLVLKARNQGPFAGYLYLDYFDSNHKAAHLFPNEDMPDNFLAAGSNRVIGAEDARQCKQRPRSCFRVSPPYGNNLIVAIWSKTQYLPHWRLGPESTTEYLARLRAVFSDSTSSQVPTLSVDYHFFTTE